MGLSVAFDLPTQIGYDSDHVMAKGEVGKVGVPISHISDMDTLFKDIPLNKVSTSMTINATAATMLAFYIAVSEKHGVSLNKLSGTIQNDILKEYIARGTYIYPPKPSIKLITDIFEFCDKHIPKWNIISISGYHIREAGSTLEQELAFTFSNAITAVSSTTMTLANDRKVNWNYNYVAYLFATLAGISKVGTYSGTGNDINVDCGFSAGARFVLVKRTDGSGDWYHWDSVRGIVAGNDAYLLLNSASAEVTNTDYIDPLSSGFTITSSAPAALNASGGTYLFYAIA